MTVGVLDHDLRERLKDIRAETLLIFGEEDRFTPLYQARLLQAGIPGAMLRVIPGAGHAAPLENPPAVDALALAWALKAVCFAAWSTAPARAVRCAALLSALQAQTAAAATAAQTEITAVAHWVQGIAHLCEGHTDAACTSLDAAHAAFSALRQPQHAAQTRVPKVMALSTHCSSSWSWATNWPLARSRSTWARWPPGRTATPTPPGCSAARRCAAPVRATAACPSTPTSRWPMR